MLLDEFLRGSWLRNLRWEAHVETESREFVGRNLSTDTSDHTAFLYGSCARSLYDEDWSSRSKGSDAAASAFRAVLIDEGVPGDVDSASWLSEVLATLKQGRRPWNRMPNERVSDDGSGDMLMTDADGFTPVLSRADRRAQTDLVVDWLHGNLTADWRNKRLPEVPAVDQGMQQAAHGTPAVCCNRKLEYL